MEATQVFTHAAGRSFLARRAARGNRGQGAMRRQRLQLRCSVLFLLLGAAERSAAQSGATGDMGQGEAAIAVRSDVSLSVKGTGGTSSERLSKLGQAVSDQM